MRKLLLIAATLLISSSALALPVPMNFPRVWRGSLMGFTMDGNSGTATGIRRQCNVDFSASWGIPRSPRQRLNGMRSCLRALPIGPRGSYYPVLFSFSFDDNGHVTGAVVLTSGNDDLFNKWSNATYVELGSPQMRTDSLIMWSTFGEDHIHWQRFLIRNHMGRIGMIHVRRDASLRNMLPEGPQ